MTDLSPEAIEAIFAEHGHHSARGDEHDYVLVYSTTAQRIARAIIEADRAQRQAGQAPASTSYTQPDKESTALLRRAVRQLNKWSETYGQWQPEWLPPAGDVELEEDIDAHIAAPAQPVAPTVEQAHAMGAKGAAPTEAERHLFEAWMRGHCWAVVGEWDGGQYVHARESGGGLVHAGAMDTRRLWAAWRDRAALAKA